MDLWPSVTLPPVGTTPPLPFVSLLKPSLSLPLLSPALSLCVARALADCAICRCSRTTYAPFCRKGPSTVLRQW
eukprot:4560964-Pleurochrysis_carterae.AAC.1